MNTGGANDEEVTDKEGSRTTQTTQFVRNWHTDSH
jgi:hypothetical protein